MKRKKENILKSWYKLCQPNKMIWFWQTFFYAAHTIMLALFTIFAAKTINCMYVKDWPHAFMWLGFELASIVLRTIFMHIQHTFWSRQVEQIRHVVARKIYNKIIRSSDSSIKGLTKDRIVNIALNNVGNLSEFPDAVSSFIAYSVLVIIALVNVFTANWLAGVLVLALGVINFFAYYKFNKRLGKILKERNEKKDLILSSYTNVLDGKTVIENLSHNSRYEDELIKSVDNQAKAYTNYYNVNSCKSNLWHAAWNVIVYAIAALMMFFVTKGSLGIETYLIIVPYLTTCTDKLNTLFDKTNSLENMRVDVDRVNLILGLTDKQKKQYGEINKEVDAYNLGLIDVNYENKSELSNNFGLLKNVDISFKMGGINVIKGAKKSGKRLIFNMLRRDIMPDSGIVLLDNLNLYDYNEKTFHNHISYCSQHPHFIRGTIKENLCVMQNDFNKVKQVCEELEFLDDIMALPSGFNTDISVVNSAEDLFMLGLIRAICSGCKILLIYELPEGVSRQFKTKIKKIVKNKVLNTKTIVLFTHDNKYDSIADLTYVVENNRVKVEKTPAKPIKTKVKQ